MRTGFNTSFNSNSPFNKTRATLFKVSEKELNKSKLVRQIALWFSVFVHLALVFVLLFFPTIKVDVRKPIVITLEDWKNPIEEKVEEKTELVNKKDSAYMAKEKEETVMPKEEAQPKPMPKPEVKPKEIVRPKVESMPKPATRPSTEETNTENSKVSDLPSLDNDSLVDELIDDMGNDFSDIDSFAGSEWEFLNNKSSKSSSLIGDSLLSLKASNRSFHVEPDFTFLDNRNYSVWVNKVVVELRVANNGAVMSAKVVEPGSMNAELDRKLTLAFSKAFLNDVSFYYRTNEVVLVTLNFKE